MDELSQRKEPFFFLISFLMDEVRIFKNSDLKNNILLIDFPNVTTVISQYADIPEFTWKAFPESLTEYQKGFHIVQENLRKGNSYLTNYTRKTEIETDLTLEEIFRFSKAKYKILVPDQLVCFSPETFIEIIDGKILTHPMKGTIDAEISDAEYKLKNDPKEKAEHYTVVDLLRNDLSMVADQVRVKDFQRIDFIKTKQTLSGTGELEQAANIHVPPAAISNLSAAAILELVRELPPATQAVFNLYVMEGYNHAEIGKLAGISEGTSKWHLSEARKKLQKKINEQSS